MICWPGLWLRRVEGGGEDADGGKLKTRKSILVGPTKLIVGGMEATFSGDFLVKFSKIFYVFSRILTYLEILNEFGKLFS